MSQLGSKFWLRLSFSPSKTGWFILFWEAIMKDHIKEFKSFLEMDLQPAIAELNKITDEKSRKHLQKLVFTNLVDRFDYCIDKTLLELIDSKELIEELLESHKKPVNESEILKLMLSAESPREIAIERLKDTLRNTILRSRHSEKLGKLLKTMNVDDNKWRKPRVNPSTGQIFDEYKPQNNKIPASIEGYADWLYSRRNAIVHGGGKSKLLDNDSKQLEKKFKCKAAKTVRLQLSSIENAGKFYTNLLAKCLL